MLNKEIVKQYAIRKCPKLVYNMASAKGVLSIFEKMLDLGVDEEAFIEEYQDESISEAYASKVDSIFEMLKLYPELKAELKRKLELKEKNDKIINLINTYKNYQEVSHLSRLYMVELYGSKVFRADTYDLSIDGLEIADNDQIIANTKKLLANPEVKVILEGQVVVGKSVARWDILVRQEDGFELLEVKGTNNVYGSNNGSYGSLKKEYLYDIAFQHYVYTAASIPLIKVGFLHLNNSFKLALKDISYPIEKEYLKDLFTSSSMIYIKKKNKYTKKNEKHLVNMLEYLQDDHYLDSRADGKFSIRAIIPYLEPIIDGEEPPTKFDYYCKTKQGCILLNECHKNINANHLFSLTNFGSIGGKWQTTRDYLEKGLEKISDIPDQELDINYPLLKADKSKKFIARMQINIAKGKASGSNLIEFRSLKKILELQYSKKPLLFFDFETFSYPIPLVAEAGPWEQICSQYSMHVLKDDYDLSNHNFESGTGGNIRHYEFIGSPYHDQHQNPERALIKKLMADFLAEGIDYKTNLYKLVVYNRNFENTQFRRMALKYPEYEEFLIACANNIIDLNDIFALGIWYHRDFNGRTSLKVTQPVLMKEKTIKSWYQDLPYDLNKTLDYKSELVQNGGVALELYQTMLRMRADGKLEENVNNEIKSALLKYCKIDSWGTVILYDIMEQALSRYNNNTIVLDFDIMNLLPNNITLDIEPLE